MDPHGVNDNNPINTENMAYTLSEITDVINEELNGTPAPTATRIPHLHHLQQSASSPAFNHLPSPTLTQLSSTASQVRSKKQKPYIQIVEQPFGKAQRFRYICEGRSAGSIPGVNSKPEIKTYPTIEIVGYEGEITIVVSCVTKDEPYKAHPHNLVGKENCVNGVCRVDVKGTNPRVVFSNLGIQCVKKRDIKEALEIRERCNVDPFKQKFGHKDQPSSVDLNAVRLAFQAIPAGGLRPLSPVVSAPIYNKKPMFELAINRLCSCSAKVSGGDEIILLCEKVDKNDVKVKFFDDGGWEAFADFQQTDIHKQTAIAFKTPRYHNTEIATKAKVFLQLVRPSDGETSEPVPFEFFPDPEQCKRKRLSTGGTAKNILRTEYQKWQNLPNSNLQTDLKDIYDLWNCNNTVPTPPEVKHEPVFSPQHFGTHRSPLQIPSPSPQPPTTPMMDRNATPSPGLMTSMHTASQAQMCELFNQHCASSAITDPPVPSTLSYAMQFMSSSGDGNPFAANKENVDTNQFGPTIYGGTLNQAAGGSNTNPFTQLTTSGGSMTPLWPTNSDPVTPTRILPTLFQDVNMMQYTQEQQQHQEQQQQQQQHQQQCAPNNNIDENMFSLSDLVRNVDPDELLSMMDNPSIQYLENSLGVVNSNLK